MDEPFGQSIEPPAVVKLDGDVPLSTSQRDSTLGDGTPGDTLLAMNNRSTGRPRLESLPHLVSSAIMSCIKTHVGHSSLSPCPPPRPVGLEVGLGGAIGTLRTVFGTILTAALSPASSAALTPALMTALSKCSRSVLSPALTTVLSPALPTGLSPALPTGLSAVLSVVLSRVPRLPPHRPCAAIPARRAVCPVK